jgi:hypothetical protein
METNMYFKKTRNTRINWREGLYYSSARFLFETPLQKIRWEQRRCYFFANILLALLSTFVLPFVAYENVKPPWCHDHEENDIKNHMGWLIEGHIDDTRPLEQIKTFILETGRFAFTPATRGDEFLLLAGMECRQVGQDIKSRSLVLISINKDGRVDHEPNKHYENETKERKDGVDFVHPFPEPAGEEIENASGSAGGSAAAPSGGVGGGDEGQVEGAVTSPGTGGGRGRGRTGGGVPSQGTGGGRAMGRTGGDVASPGTFGGRGGGGEREVVLQVRVQVVVVRGVELEVLLQVRVHLVAVGVVKLEVMFWFRVRQRVLKLFLVHAYCEVERRNMFLRLQGHISRLHEILQCLKSISSVGTKKIRGEKNPKNECFP